MSRPALTQIAPAAWRLEPSGAMRVPVVLYADAALIEGMDDKVFEQAVNVASLPALI